MNNRFTLSLWGNLFNVAQWRQNMYNYEDSELQKKPIGALAYESEG